MPNESLVFDPTVDPTIVSCRTSEKYVRHPADVIPAFIAEMDFTVAPPIKRALLSAIENSDLGYTFEGTAFARSVAGFVQRRFSVNVDPSRVVLIPDVMAGVGDCLRLLTQPGESVVISSPVYAPFRGTIREVERCVVDVPLLRDDAGRYDLDLAGIERAFAGGARAYLLCNPHNPVGRVWSHEQLVRVGELARTHNVIVLCDEIHAALVYRAAQHMSFLALDPELTRNAIVYTSASKAFNLAGLKCAALIAGSDEMRDRLRALSVETPYRASILGLIATQVAFNECDDWLDGLRAYLDGSRTHLGELLAREMQQVRYVAPEASYLAWLDCSALGYGDDPAKEFLERGRVALARGYDFGPSGRGFVRLNFGTSRDRLQEIVRRMHEAELRPYGVSVPG